MLRRYMDLYYDLVADKPTNRAVRYGPAGFLASELMHPEACLLIAPHPDDESIGAGVWMSKRRGDVTLLHVTDGAPLDPQYARSCGFADPEMYSVARRRELFAALKIAGVTQSQSLRLGFTDKDTIRSYRS